MGHTPLGYKIENGVAVIDEKSAQKVKEIFDCYLSGLSLRDISTKFELNTSHASIKKILANKKYLGDEFYPTIIDEGTLKKVAEEMEKRAVKLGRNKLKGKKTQINIPTSFNVLPIKEYHSNPFMQAQYVYSLIQSEVF